MQLTLSSTVLLLSSLVTAAPVDSSTSSGLTGRAASGYQGPGVYTFSNAKNNLRADLLNGNPAPGTSINMWGSSGPYYNAHQYWQIADVGQGQVIIINNGTGTLFSAGSGVSDGQATNCTGQAYPPWRAEARWTVDNQGSATGPVLFHSVAYPSNVMDILNVDQPFGTNTPVQAAAKSGAQSQEWVLQLHV
ncbi:MAG: hypothetical protein Q9195_006778 [Heterodermia aff. obscurata]